MTNYTVRLQCAADRDAAHDLAADFDAIADALFELGGVHDQDLDADLTEGTVIFTMGVVADRESVALDRALGVVRTALHAAGRGTPGWERHYRLLRQEVEEHPVAAR